MADTAPLLHELATLFRDVLELQKQGATTRQLGRAHGHVDGYMKALLDAGLVTQRELLAVLARVRRESNGPATAEALPSKDVVAA